MDRSSVCWSGRQNYAKSNRTSPNNQQLKTKHLPCSSSDPRAAGSNALAEVLYKLGTSTDETAAPANITT